MASERGQAAEAAHVDAVLALAQSARSRCGTTTVVAIDGPSGAGKTTLATAVAAALEAPVVHMDDLVPGWDGLAEAVRSVTAQVLEPISRGEPAAYRRWDWLRNTWAETMSVPRARVIVLEGCACSAQPAGEYAAVRIWVEADLVVRMRRGLERDGEAYRPHWHHWAAQEERLFRADGTRARADLVIDTTGA
jgi:uridine kinase